MAINNQNMRLPHIKEKLKKSWAIETIDTATRRTRVMNLINNWSISKLEEHIDFIIKNPLIFIAWDEVTWLDLNFMKLAKWVIWKNNPNRPLLDRIRSKLNQASYAVWEAKVKLSQQMPLSSERIILGTKWRVEMILSWLMEPRVISDISVNR